MVPGLRLRILVALAATVKFTRNAQLRIGKCMRRGRFAIRHATVVANERVVCPGLPQGAALGEALTLPSGTATADSEGCSRALTPCRSALTPPRPRTSAPMPRRKPRGRPLDGWLIIDKPPGLTSTDVVNRVRRAFDAQKAGHGGTLDPLATGVLPIAFGAATKTVPYVMDGTKLYRFTLRFGEARDTDDADGRLTATSPMSAPTDAQIRAALPQNSAATSCRSRRPSRR